MIKDLKSKPKSGRKFVVRFGDVVRLLKQFKLHDYSHERIAVRFINSDYKTEDSLTLVVFEQGKSIDIYSVDESFLEVITASLYSKAIELFSQVPNSNVRHWNRSKHYYYRIILEISSNKFLLQKVTNTFTEKFSFEQKASNRRTIKQVTQKIESVQNIEI